MNKNIFETLLGAIVLLVAITFVIISYNSGSIEVSANSGYRIYANFDDVDGLQVGSDVKIGGVKVGSVAAMSLDQNTYRAVIEMIINNNVKIPKDTTASVVGNGLLSDKHIALMVGGDDVMLKDNDTITMTQSATNLETLLGKFIFGGKSKGESDDKSSTAGTTPQPLDAARQG